ncbi:HNH endonuclease [Bradyrhizobium erythrophlei]|uniref:HNH endonuclease n=1 Tax=Bradyrhizobium erythrophlei TaxID=1437360 RepID=A0A1M5PPL3_9BRAD|nr:HNH endonuclease [Bradyrhizobium erythrophlei]SHH03712.1 HNH endonuclease [Bradyrhizobium erythrophlei]
MNDNNEIWRPIPRLPEYLASALGRVMRLPHLAPLPKGGFRVYGGVPTTGTWDPEELRFVLVYKGKTHKVHVLVCEAFHGAKPFEEAVVMHLDEDSSNNKPSNLEWGTQKQNLNFPGFKRLRSELSLKMWEERRAA